MIHFVDNSIGFVSVPQFGVGHFHLRRRRTHRMHGRIVGDLLIDFVQ